MFAPVPESGKTFRHNVLRSGSVSREGTGYGNELVLETEKEPAEFFRTNRTRQHHSIQYARKYKK